MVFGFCHRSKHCIELGLPVTEYAQAETDTTHCEAGSESQILVKTRIIAKWYEGKKQVVQPQCEWAIVIHWIPHRMDKQYACSGECKFEYVWTRGPE